MNQENNNYNSKFLNSSSSSSSSIQKLEETIKEKDKKIEKQEQELEKFKKLKIFVPNDIEETTSKIYRKKLTKHDLKGQKKTKRTSKGKEIVEYCDYYEKGNIGFLLNPTGMIRLKGEVPKVYVSQDKNVKLLCALVMLQQSKKKKKTATAKFTFKQYAKWRDYSEKEINKGGNFIQELKNDIYAGAYLTYEVLQMRGGELYRVSGIPNFYTLAEPLTNPKKEWEITFTPSYAKGILRFLRGERSQYFTHFLKEIADRETTRKPYLHYFYDELAFRRRVGITMPVKVKNLLGRMGVNEQCLERPKKCFEILRECLVYFSEKYPQELQSATLTASSKKTIKQAEEKDKIQRSGVLPIYDFKKFKEHSKNYEDFKEVLMKNIGTDDIREALISFEKEEQEYFNPDELVKDFFKWKEQCENYGQKKLEADNNVIKNWLVFSIKILGLERMSELFNQEINSLRPNVYHFLWKIVKPEREEKLRERKQKLQQF